ncbi:MAG: hypothetical protein AAFP19_11300, partial [Bacteroidota bacterium]
MKENKTQSTIGGFVVEKQALKQILAEEGTIGLAFAVDQPGVASGVNLNVLRVFLEQDELKAEHREVGVCHGAPDVYQYPAQGVQDFVFNYGAQLVSDQFFFGFCLKEKFHILDKEDHDEVYIGGGYRNFGTNGPYDKPQWFSLTIAMRTSIQTIEEGKHVFSHSSTGIPTRIGLHHPVLKDLTPSFSIDQLMEIVIKNQTSHLAAVIKSLIVNL